MDGINKQTAKTQCDSHCETCPMQWQMQCSARFAHKNNQNQKVLEEKIEEVSNLLDAIQKKIDNIFGTEEITSSPSDATDNSNIVEPKETVYTVL